MGIVLGILLFSFLILFHELGHFLVAKKNGIRVDEFCLGLGPKLVGREFRGTLFSLRLLPFGGACIMGEDDPEIRDPDSFNGKSVWARLSVVAAGPFFNLLLGFILAVTLVAWRGYDAPVVGDVVEGFPAQEAGLQAGDEILEINGNRTYFWREISLYNTLHPGERVRITYRRDGRTQEVTLLPQADEAGQYLYGISSTGIQTRVGLGGALLQGLREMEYVVEYTYQSLGMLLTGQVGLRDLSGPVGIVDLMEDTYQAYRPLGMEVVVQNFLSLGLLLTVNLAIMNLLPIPALDGGRILFLLVEAIRGKRISPVREGYVNLVGFAALMLLMGVILVSDVLKLF